MTFSVAILGKPNVGKSSLFNRLCGKRLAIVDDQPGVTRDRKTFKANLAGMQFDIIDTAGWEGSDANLMPQLMAKQSIMAAEEADMLLFMLDAKYGIGPDDIEFARLVRQLEKPVSLVVNKCDSKHTIEFKDIYKLGLGEPIFISTHTRSGFDDLYESISVLSKSIKNKPLDQKLYLDALKVCIVGRPNVGKSTLFNSMLQIERAITSPIAGTTRDAIQHFYEYRGKVIELIDTAGLRKKKNIENNIEGMSVGETINAIRRCHVTILVIDATQPLEKQDLSIAHIAINEGKAVVLVANKMDLIENKRAFIGDLNYLVSKSLHELNGLPILTTIALDGIDHNELFQLVIDVEKKWKFQLSTGPVNRWLEKTTSAHIPPLAKNGKRIRLKYATQTGIKPPTFTIFANVPEELPESYTQYLSNSLRNTFDLGGIPIRLIYKKNKNPYSAKSV